MNLVSMDSYVPDYGHFSKLVKVALELEDCFGKGEHSKHYNNDNNFIYQFYRRVQSFKCKSNCNFASIFDGIEKVTLNISGLMEFLKTMGRQLNELTLSCSSDSDSTNIEGGGKLAKNKQTLQANTKIANKQISKHKN